jgi:preprotein translocase subunit SecD
VGIRTFVLVGDSVLGTDDVTDATAKLESIGEGPPMAYVAVTLSPASSTRFEDATREWTSRRLAIVIDDVIQSAPVIRTAIAGGRISITLAVGEPDERLAEARRLARALGGR